MQESGVLGWKVVWRTGGKKDRDQIFPNPM